MYVSDLFITFVRNILHSDERLARYTRITFEQCGLHVKCPLLLSHFNHNWKAPTNFSKIPQHRTLRQSVQRFINYMQTSGQTGMANFATCAVIMKKEKQI
jgi:hypothetical protein